MSGGRHGFPAQPGDTAEACPGSIARCAAAAAGGCGRRIGVRLAVARAPASHTQGAHLSASGRTGAIRARCGFVLASHLAGGCGVRQTPCAWPGDGRMFAMPGTDVEVIATNDRELVEARISGLSRKQTAERFGVSPAVVRAAERKFAEDATDLECERAIVGEQLSRLVHVFFNLARDGNARAAELMVDLTRRKSELLGLDAPRALTIEQRPPEHQPPSSLDRITSVIADIVAERVSAVDGDKPLN